MKTGFGYLPNMAEVYRVTALPPPKDNAPQYRARNDDSRHERVMVEGNLEEIDAPHPFAAPASL